MTIFIIVTSNRVSLYKKFRIEVFFRSVVFLTSFAISFMIEFLASLWQLSFCLPFHSYKPWHLSYSVFCSSLLQRVTEKPNRQFLDEYVLPMGLIAHHCRLRLDYSAQIFLQSLPYLSNSRQLLVLRYNTVIRRARPLFRPWCMIPGRM